MQQLFTYIIFQDEIDGHFDVENVVQIHESLVGDSSADVKYSYKSGTKFSDLEKDMIVAEVITDFKWNSVKVIGKQNKVKPSIVESWVNEAGFDTPTEIVKSSIVKQCLDAEVSPAKLAQSNGCHSDTVRNWAKADGGVLPGKYAQQFTKSAPHDSKTIFPCPKQHCSFETTTSSLLDKHIKCKYEGLITYYPI